MAKEVKIPIAVVDRVTAPLAKMDKAAFRFSRTIEKTVTGAFAKLRAAQRSILSLQGLLAGAFAFAAGKGLKSLIDEVDALGKLSIATGETVEQLSALRGAFELAGLAGEDLERVVKQLSAAQAGAIAGQKDRITVFGQLGIDVQRLRDLGPAALLQEIARGLEQYDVGAGRAILSKLLPDAPATSLLPLVGGGLEQFQRTIEEVRRSGGIFTQDDADRAAQINDSLTLLRGTLKALVFDVVREFGPGVAAVLQQIRETLPQVRELGQQIGFAWERVFGGADESVASLQDRLDSVRQDMQELARTGRRLEAGGELGPNRQEVLQQGLLRLREQEAALVDRIAAARGRQGEAEAALLERAKVAARQYQEALQSVTGVDPTDRATSTAQAAQDALRRRFLQSQPFESRGVRAELFDLDTEEQIRQLEDLARAAGHDAAPAVAALVEQFELLRAQLREREIGDFGAGFSDQIRRTADEWRDLTRAGERTADVLTGAFNGVGDVIADSLFDSAFDAKAAIKDLAESAVRDLARIAIQAAVTGPLLASLSGGGSAVFGSFGIFGKGAAFDRGRVHPFATGGVVDRPTVFPFERGIGLMAERGPEAIMPLARRPDGSLGVRADNGGRGGGDIVFQISGVSDAESFLRRRGEIRAFLLTALREDAQVRSLVRQS